MASRVDEILKRYGFARNAQTTWDVQGNHIIRHQVLEAIARDLEIKWEKPVVLRAEREECVLLVSGTMDDKLEWTVGEALVGVNYRVSGKQAGYVYSMAEKRGKDRLIYKFLGLAEQQEEEQAEPTKPAADMTIAEKLKHNIGRKATLQELNEYILQPYVKNAIGGLGPEDLTAVSDFIAQTRKTLAPGVWSDQLERAKTSLAKAKNEQEVNSYEEIMKEQEFAEAPADILQAFADLCESRRYILQKQ